MASPTLDLLCCSYLQFTNTTPYTNISTIADVARVDERKDFLQRTKQLFYLYNSTVILMSVFSIGGAICMLFPKLRCSVDGTTGVTGRAAVGTPRSSALETRQKWIVFWLSFADIMACLGLLVLSSESIRILVLSEDDPGPDPDPFSGPAWEWLCILATAWIHFFFLATYMWTTCFAVDVYLYLRKTTIRKIFRAYSFFSWCLPMIFLTIGLVALYKTTEPQFACAGKDGDKTWLRTFYLCLFVPLLVVLVANPTLYILASRKVSPLMRAGGMYRDREREIERQVRRKFLRIVTVLVVCWFPNVINGILLLSGVPVVVNARHGEQQHQKLNTVYAILWITMAILNPLQAFLNTLVYWGPTGCNILANPTRSDDSYDTMPASAQSHPPWRDAAVPSDNETTPLVRERTRDPVN